MINNNESTGSLLQAKTKNNNSGFSKICPFKITLGIVTAATVILCCVLMRQNTIRANERIKISTDQANQEASAKSKRDARTKKLQDKMQERQKLSQVAFDSLYNEYIDIAKKIKHLEAKDADLQLKLSDETLLHETITNENDALIRKSIEEYDASIHDKYYEAQDRVQQVEQYNLDHPN